MSTVLLVPVLVIGFVFLLLYFIRTDFTFRNISPEDLKEFVEVLLYRGADESFMVIKKKGSKKFLQFSKKIVKKGNVDIYFAFPVAEWSEMYTNEILNTLEDKGIEFMITKATKYSPLDFIDANLHDDVIKCVEIIEEVFDNIFKIEQNKKYIIKFSSICPSNKKIGY